MAQVTYLELSEGREHKFYEVTLDGPQLTLRYGRIGTAGQSKTTTLANPAAALAEAQKKLTEKRKKGYQDAVLGSTEKKAVEKLKWWLPKKMEPYRTKIEATWKPVIYLSLGEPTENPLENKLGGVPYRLKGAEWPATSDQTPMTFLAQLNFATLPPAQGFPSQGILQFFIGRNDFYGSDFMRGATDSSADYEVRWIAEPVEDQTQLDFSIPEPPHGSEENHFSPFLGDSLGWGFSGDSTLQPMTARDRLFETTIGLDFCDESDSPDEDLSFGEWLEENYNEISCSSKHQIGGYPSFTQEDPRRTDDPRILLFQLVSEGGDILMWGDMGIANFFIHPDDLAARDFSRVAYNWDCS